jgi:antitoxin ParD1/3/4
MHDEEEHAKRLTSIKARISQSLDDPRPAIPLADAFARIRSNIERLPRASASLNHQ